MILFEKFPRNVKSNNWKTAGQEQNKKKMPLAVAAEKMPLELAAASRPRPSTGLDAGVQCIFRNMFNMV